MRGAAPSASCPRCGEIAPASDARLVSCASCKLSFDPAAERPVSIRRNRGQKLIERIKVTRTPTSLTLRFNFERRSGLAILVVGLGIVAGAAVLGPTTLGIGLGVAISYIGFGYLGPQVIHVDCEHVTVGRLADVFVAVVWTQREAAVRLISFRRARGGERQVYHSLFG